MPPKAGFFCRCLWPRRRCSTEWPRSSGKAEKKDLALAPGRLVDYSSPVAEKDAALRLNLATAGSSRARGPPTRHGARAHPPTRRRYLRVWETDSGTRHPSLCRMALVATSQQGVGDWLDPTPFWDDDVVSWHGNVSLPQRVFSLLLFLSNHTALSLRGAEKISAIKLWYAFRVYSKKENLGCVFQN